jgi:hypothetical protein
MKVSFPVEVYASHAEAVAPADLQVKQQALARARHVVPATPVVLLPAN